MPPELYDQVFDAPIVHLGGTGLLRKLDGEKSRILLAEAKRRGRIVTFDLIAATAKTIEIVEPLLPFIDYFMPSIEEARDISGRTAPEDCAAFYLDRGTTCCVFTLGGDGAYYAHRDGTRLHVPAYNIKVIDTTGCGDAFDAGFITALHHRMEPETAVRFAQAAAALVATGLGSDAGIVSFEDTLGRCGEASGDREAAETRKRREFGCCHFGTPRQPKGLLADTQRRASNATSPCVSIPRGCSGKLRLVLHGGGNTSVKTKVRDLVGDSWDVLCVKGSGWTWRDPSRRACRRSSSAPF